MFDLAWSEIALIAVVALIVIGPKDLPDAVRGVARMVKKARAMAGEMQGHVDEMVREANLHEVRETIQDIRNFNIRDTIEKHVDSDGSLRSALKDPLGEHAANATPPAFIPPAAEPAATPAVAEPLPAPAFVPPDFLPPPPVAAVAVAPDPVVPAPAMAATPVPPSAIPPIAPMAMPAAAAAAAPVGARES
jgi:sec-independent protein translocase protein TatB